MACFRQSFPHRSGGPKGRRPQSAKRDIPSQGIAPPAPDDSQNQSRIGENAAPFIKSQKPRVVVRKSADGMRVNEREHRQKAGTGGEAKCKQRQTGEPCLWCPTSHPANPTKDDRSRQDHIDRDHENNQSNFFDNGFHARFKGDYRSIRFTQRIVGERSRFHSKPLNERNGLMSAVERNRARVYATRKLRARLGRQTLESR